MYSRERRLQRTDRASIRKPGITLLLITLDKLDFISGFDAGSVVVDAAPFFDDALIIFFLFKSYQFKTVIS